MIKTENQPDYDLGTVPPAIPQVNPLSGEPAINDHIICKALAILKTRMVNKESFVIKSSSDVINFLRLKLSEKEHEVFAVMFLTTRHQLIKYEEMFRGTIDTASVYPREIVKEALKHNAAAIICAHNHPSGNSTHSTADERITTKIKNALDLMDIKLLDHIIIGSDNTTSLAEKGYI